MERIKRLFPLGWFNKQRKNTGVDCDGALERFRGSLAKKRFKEPDLNAPLKEMTLVVLDTETTGFKPHLGDEIISVGACLIEDGKILPENFHKLVNPGRPIPPFITELTGISDEMVSGAEDFCSVAESFLEFLQNDIIVGHSIGFDLNFLNHKLRASGIRITNPHLDTAVLSKATCPEYKIHTLDSILTRMDIPPEGRHTALGDALLTAQVFIKYYLDFDSLGIYTFRDLQCFLRNAALPKI